MVDIEIEKKRVIQNANQRLKVFVSSTLHELAEEREAARSAISHMRLHPVMLEMGPQPQPAPPRSLYQSFIEESQVFIGIYWQKYGESIAGADWSEIEDEFMLSEGKPRLIYIKRPAYEVEKQMTHFINSIQDAGLSYKTFSDTNELCEMIENDLALLLTERFELTDQIISPVKTISRERIELPMPATPLIGREVEVKELTELLTNDSTRIITLSGPGGIGKTRLALEVAWQMQGNFSDGVFFLPLAHVSDPALVPATIAQSLFPKESSLRSAEEMIKEGLKEKNSLLLIDNFEQVVEAANIVSFIVAQCPHIKIMITSRELLKISGEVEFAVSPLSVPDLKEDNPLADQFRFIVSQSSAVQLFVERAHAIKPGFSLTKENAAAVAGICTKLDGIPLAIELAAARSKVLSPREMLPHLNRSLGFLTDGNRDLPERHRRLHATIDWSYGLLESDEKQLLRRLSVFAGGFNMRSASVITCSTDEPNEAPWSRLAMYMRDPSVEMPVAYPAPDYAVVACIESLVNKNMLYTQEIEDGETRFYLYNAISEYAQVRLEEAGESTYIQKNHLVFFLRMAEESTYILRSSEAPGHYRELDREMENMRAALNYGMKEYPVLALRIAIGLGEYWDTRNMPREAKWWLQNLLKKVENAEDPYPSAIPLLALVELSRIEFRLGNYSEAISITEELMNTGRQTANKYALVDGILFYCLVASYAVDSPADTASLSEEGLNLARELNYALAEVDMLQNITAHATMNGQSEKAIELAGKSLELARAIGATRWEAIAHGWHGFASLNLARVEEAEKAFSMGLELCSRLNDNMLITYCFLGFAQVSLMGSNVEKGIRLIGAVERLTERSGTSLVPSIKFMFSQIEDTVRTQLGEEIFNSLKTEGRRLSLEDACVLANI